MKKNFEWTCKHTWKRSAYNTYYANSWLYYTLAV